MTGEKEKKTENRKIDEKMTKQLVVDKYWHQWLKMEAVRAGMSIKTFLEENLADIQASKNEKI